MWCHLIIHFLILSRKPIGTALESSCLKAGTDITGLVLILMISDQSTYTCLHHNTPFYAFVSHILTFVRFTDFFMIGEWHLWNMYTGTCWKSCIQFWEYLENPGEIQNTGCKSARSNAKGLIKGSRAAPTLSLNRHMIRVCS